MVRIFKHYTPVSLLALASAEFGVLLGSLYVGVWLRFGQKLAIDPEIGPVSPIFPKALAFALVHFVVMASLGLYQRDHEEPLKVYARLVMSFVVGFVAMTLLFYAVPSLFLGRGAFALGFAVAFAGVALTRWIYLSATADKGMKRRVLVLGTGTRAAKVDALARAAGGRQGFHVVGYLPLKGEQHFVDKDLILREPGTICEIAQRHHVGEVVIGVRDRRGGGLPMQEVLACKFEGMNVVELTTFFERETGHVELQSLNPSWLIFSEGFDQGLLRDSSKRVFDLIVSTALFVATLPVMLTTMLLIVLESRGPVFYRQTRVGLGGRPFEVLKFRSMRPDAEKGGKPQWAKANDDRVTRVGRFIRKVRIDELPQIINVLRGEMSFVGPRPERPFFVDDLAKQIAYYSHRHNVKPGITGWAQIRYPYGASLEDAIEKLQYDLYYVKNHTLFLDVIILLQTAQVVLFGKGAR